MLCAAAVALSSILAASFDFNAFGIQARLQTRPIAEAGWLESPTPSYHDIAAVQSSATRVVELVVLIGLLAGLLVALSAFLTLVWTAQSARRGELAARAALGAAPLTLLRELSWPVAHALGVGAVAGLLVGAALNSALRASWPGVVIGTQGGALLRGVAGGVLSALLLSLITLSLLWLVATHRRLADRLRAGERATASLADTRVRELFSALQIAVSTALLVVGALLGSRAGVEDAQGIVSDNADQLWMRAISTDHAAPLSQRAASLRSLLATDTSAAPDRGSVAGSGAVLGVGVRDRLYSECDNCPRMPTTLRTMSLYSVGPAYFTLLGVPFLRGRDFARTDGPDAAPVVIVNDSFVREMFGPRGNGLGRVVRLQLGLGEAHRIVGVIADLRGGAPGAPRHGEPVAYFSALQHPPRNIDLLSRPTPQAQESSVDTALVRTVGAARAVAQAPLQSVAAGIRWLTAFCFLLAAYGVYATSSLLVQGRRRELGLRMALGSTPAGLMRHVLGYALRLVFVGVCIGGLVAFVAQRALDFVLPEVPLRATLFLEAALLLTLTTLAGVSRPAWQSCRAADLLGGNARVSVSGSRK